MWDGLPDAFLGGAFGDKSTEKCRDLNLRPTPRPYERKQNKFKVSFIQLLTLAPVSSQFKFHHEDPKGRV